MRMIDAFLLATLLGCGGGQAPKESAKPVARPNPQKEEPKPLTLTERISFHDKCFVDFMDEDESLFGRCYTDESTVQIVDGGQEPSKGIEGATAQAQPLWTAFKLEGESVLVLGSGDKALTVALMAGTHEGEFMGAPATGKKFGLLFAEVTTLDARGRHGNVRIYLDGATMIGQLGLSKAKVRPAMNKSGASAQPVMATGDEAEQKNLEVVKGGLELFNKQDWKGLAGLYAAEAVIADQMRAADSRGAKAIDKTFKELAKAFPDAKEEVGEMWAAGDYVVAETTFTGTNKAAAPGMGIKKATRKPVSLHTLHVLELNDGKVVNHWVFGNGVALATQLGLLPPSKKAK